MVGLVGVGLFTAGTDTYGVIKTNRVQTEKPTLDGMAYLRIKAPDELAAYEWLNRNIQGIPVILEAHGDSYQEFTRVSMNTGLPTVLGWGTTSSSAPIRGTRSIAAKPTFSWPTRALTRTRSAAILQRYHVALVFVGALERRTYAGANLQRFGEWTDLLTPVYQNPGVSIFAVNGNFKGTMPVSTIEDVAQVAGGEEPPRAQDAPGQLQQPRGIAVNSEGNIVVCDFGNNRIQEFNRELAFVHAWGTSGELPGQFKEPCGVAVAPNGEIVVADTWNQRVQVFDKDGKSCASSAAGSTARAASPIDAKGAVFVSDTGNNRIVRFSAAGQKEIEWGSKGPEPGKFWEPTGVTTDAAGQVYVVDNGNGRLQIFTRDGQFVSAFAVPGWESKVFSEPYVTLDPRGTLWVTVPGEKEVRSYDRTGKLLATIKGQSMPGVTFETPMGIAYSAPSKELIISDLERRIVRIRYADR